MFLTALVGMRPIMRKAVLFWFVLLALALFNATIRETTYKPLLTPYIGIWAHQVSSITGIALFFTSIYIFLNRNRGNYQRKDLLAVGHIWIGMTLVFETIMNMYFRHLSFAQVLETYYFWKGDTWSFVLLSLVISPYVADSLLSKRKENNKTS